MSGGVVSQFDHDLLDQTYPHSAGLEDDPDAPDPVGVRRGVLLDPERANRKPRRVELARPDTGGTQAGQRDE